MLGQRKRRAFALAAVGTAAAVVGALAPLDAAKADHGEFEVSRGSIASRMPTAST